MVSAPEPHYVLTTHQSPRYSTIPENLQVIQAEVGFSVRIRLALIYLATHTREFPKGNSAAAVGNI